MGPRAKAETAAPDPQRAVPTWAQSLPGRNRGDLTLYLRYVRRAIEFSASAKLNPVLRVQLDQLHLTLETGSGGLENFVQHAGIEKESGTKIELVALGLDS